MATSVWATGSGKHLRFKRDEVLAWFETKRDEA